jgi:hypothetical protein
MEIKVPQESYVTILCDIITTCAKPDSRIRQQQKQNTETDQVRVRILEFNFPVSEPNKKNLCGRKQNKNNRIYVLNTVCVLLAFNSCFLINGILISKYAKLNNIVTFILIARQRIGKHIPAKHTHVTEGRPLLGNGPVNPLP